MGGFHQDSIRFNIANQRGRFLQLQSDNDVSVIAGTDYNVVATNDINLLTSRDINLKTDSPGRDINLVSFGGSIDVNASHEIDIHAGDAIYINTPIFQVNGADVGGLPSVATVTPPIAWTFENGGEIDTSADFAINIGGFLSLIGSDVVTYGRLGFYGTNPGVTQQVVPLTAPSLQNLIDALLATGLIAQHD